MRYVFSCLYHQTLGGSVASFTYSMMLNHFCLYEQLLSDEDNFRGYQLKALDLSKYMRLDQPAARALNLFSLPTDSTFIAKKALSSDESHASLADKSWSLYGVLNKCRTAMGSRRLMQWIKQPLLSIDDIGIADLLFVFFFFSRNNSDTHKNS